MKLLISIVILVAASVIRSFTFAKITHMFQQMEFLSSQSKGFHQGEFNRTVAAGNKNKAIVFHNNETYLHDHLTQRSIIKSRRDLPKTEFESMGKLWKDNLIGDLEKHPELENDKDIAAYIKKLSDDAFQLYESMYKHENRLTLWEVGTTKSAKLTALFQNLSKLAKAFKMRGTKLFNKKDVFKTIISGLEFMIAEGRYSGSEYFDNWWDWQIGVIQEFVNILFILREDLQEEKIARYTTIMTKYLPNPYRQLLYVAETRSVDSGFNPNYKSEGANRIDMAWSSLGLGILINDSEKITESIESIIETLRIVTKGDGFYPDGSFIQHSYVPYTGAYGNILVKGLGEILSVVAGTRWQVDANILTSFVETIKKAYIPLIVNGETMSYVNGRSISRARTPEFIDSSTMFNILTISNFADSKNKQELHQAVKFWMADNPNYYFGNPRNFKDLLLAKELMSNIAIKISNTKPFLGCRLYSSMDRFVYSNNNITIGISMYSKRIASYEAINNENKKGWHTGDGMVYVYNNDQQFGSEYWPTVDWYKLPGTTVDTQPMSAERNLRTSYGFTSNERYVGGTTDNKDAVVAMQLNKAGTKNSGKYINMNLTAKKSWFIFDGIIISLGADINGDTTNSIETIIENRLLDASSTYRFINQNEEEVNTTDARLVNASDWFLLKSSKENQNIGYMILDDQIISTKREKRTGTYKDINDLFPSSDLHSGSYQKIIVEHGKHVRQGKYAYLTYPNADASVLKSLVRHQRFRVLKNSHNIQAVKDTVTNKVGATIWNHVGGNVKGITVNKPATLLYMKDTLNNQITLSVSNPMQTDEILEVQLPRQIKEVVFKDIGVYLKTATKVVINTTGSMGKTFRIIANENINKRQQLSRRT